MNEKKQPTAGEGERLRQLLNSNFNGSELTVTVRENIAKTAKEAAALDDAGPGNSYAFIIGTIRGVAESEYITADEKVDRINLLLAEFDKARKSL